MQYLAHGNSSLPETNNPPERDTLSWKELVVKTIRNFPADFFGSFARFPWGIQRIA